jgi:Mn2+/Fe2+ NRAMP family transporter
MAAVILAEFAGITGLMAITVDLLQEWIKYTSGHYNWAIKLALIICVSSFLLTILWRGTYQYLERLLGVLVAVMGISFVGTAFLVVPSWRDVAAGLVPAVPKEPDAALIVAGMAGTTFGSAILYCRSITIKAKEWTLSDERHARVDAVVSAVMMFVLSIVVMICAAGTLYVIHKPVEQAVDMVRTLEPLAGRFALSVFIIGIVGAGLSSLIPTILIAPWLISDYSNSRIDPSSRISRFFVSIGVLVGVVGPYIKAKPVFIMIVTMALLAVILPLSTVAITILLNQKEHMGKFKNSALMNLACAGAIVFSVVMSYYGVIGLLEYFR